MNQLTGTASDLPDRRRTELSARPAWTGPRVWILVWRKMGSVQSSRGGAGQPVWTRTLIGWHIVFWVLLGMTLALSFLGDLGAVRQALFAGTVVVLGAAYQFIGLHAIRSRRALPSYVYRLVLIACLTVLIGIYPQSVFLPDGFQVNEPGGSWQLGTGAIVLTVWLIVGLFLAQRVFRWTRRDAG